MARSKTAELRDALAIQLNSWMASERHVVAVEKCWSVRKKLRPEEMTPGRVRAYVSPGPQSVVGESRAAITAVVGAQITLAGLVQGDTAGAIAETVTFLREEIQRWILDHKSKGHEPLDGWRFDEFSQSVADSEPVIEEIFVEHNVVATFVAPLYSQTY